MPKTLQDIDKKATAKAQNEPDVETYIAKFLSNLDYHLKFRKTGVADIDKHWPSKSDDPKRPGAPDVLAYLSENHTYPFCVLENKAPTESIEDALREAKSYIEGLHKGKPLTPGLPRLAAGFNGKQLRLAYFNHEKTWLSLKIDGKEVADAFPFPKNLGNGISSTGNILVSAGYANASDLRKILPALKTIYRSIPILASGRRPIDFTVALLTLRMLTEMLPDWGSWAEQPGLAVGTSKDDAIGDRFLTLVQKIFKSPPLKQRYGDIFKFSEKSSSTKEEVAFSFEDCLKEIKPDANFFSQMFDVLDGLPPLHGADFDVFGEVYQSIGDDATKKALGEFFTGRHIISSVVPVLFKRAGIESFDNGMKGKTIADIACGTGGFLTETLRHIRKRFALDETSTQSFASKAFFGYDLSQSNASRARVNMYFAGDGFSIIEGGLDTLGTPVLPNIPAEGFDFILTNPPYGTSSLYKRTDEAFLVKMLSLLKVGAGWGLIVLPTGVIENPRSSNVRLDLLRKARITDVIALPKHAFAPYTTQRTAIVIFQRREKELAGTNWDDVVKEVGKEKISLFTVDNDGYANSDKRYETNRKSSSGEWLHNDLAGWVAKDGSAQPSKLFAAAIDGKSPKSGGNEFGEPIGKKHCLLTIKQMYGFSSQKDSEQGRGLSLMPAAYLRPDHYLVPLNDYYVKAAAIIGFVKGQSKGLPSFESELKSTLTNPIDCASKSATSTWKIKDVFDIEKGNQGLTEAMIYSQFDPNGYWVYGGGETLPRFKIGKASKNNKGLLITVHKGPALIVAMDGSSGAVRVIKSDSFCCNHHACVLTLKPGVRLNLYAVAQQIEGGLRSMASNKEGSATLTLPFLEEFSFQLPSNKRDVRRIAACRKILANIRDRFFGTR